MRYPWSMHFLFVGLASSFLVLLFLFATTAAPPAAPEPPASSDLCTPAAEVCDGLDNDCDGFTDAADPDLPCCADADCAASDWCSSSACVARVLCYPDDDDDGFGDSSHPGQLFPASSCGAVAGWVADATDCDDDPVSCGASCYPGAVEVCDAYDNDCDGTANDNLSRLSPGQDGLCSGNSEYCGADGSWYADIDNYDPSVEVCDGLDNDCDGVADDNLSLPSLGLPGVCEGYNYSCVGGAEVAFLDGIPSYEAEESSCDGADNNCDGAVDETCDCSPGDTQPCGPANETGECSSGVQTCDAAGTWGACVGAVYASAEVCDGLDNDCDGSADNFSVVTSCGVGVCTGNTGTQTCQGSEWGVDTCDPFFGAGVEVCDGADNDCDGLADEEGPDLSLPAADRTLGVCADALKVCSGGELQEPDYSSLPLFEVDEASCDGFDNDCDGSVDEDFVRVAVNTLGLCSANTEYCSNDTWYDSPGNYEPRAEECDGLDNDCDGDSDEDVVMSSLLLPGVCEGYNYSCVGGEEVADLSSVPFYEAEEVACDGLDNDCDEGVDEECPCTPGDNRSCGPLNDTGVCSFGLQTCNATGSWGACVGAVLPAEEECNGLDDDCDGVVDGFTVTTFCGLGACGGNTGNETCVNGSFVNDTCDAYLGSSSESCNDVDDDCDGEVDEGACKSGGSSSSSWTYPSFDDDDDVVPLEEEPLEEVPVKVDPDEINISWSYDEANRVASASVSEPAFGAKRFHGNIPQGPFLNRTKLKKVNDTSALSTPLPPDYQVYEAMRFDGSVQGVVFEELKMSFAVRQSWLREHNLSEEEVSVIYAHDGGWRKGAVEYDEEESLFFAKLANAELGEFVLGAGSLPKPAVVERPAAPAQVTVEDALSDAGKESRHWASYVAFIFVAVSILSGIVVFSIRHMVQRAPASGLSRSFEHPSVQQHSTGPQQAADARFSALDAYIRKKRAEGVPDKVIEQRLVEHRWDPSLVRSRLQSP